jgi:16S rRNA (guanine527-N7)-methyltransferase
VLIVSEPPEQTDRWPIDGVAEFGLELAEQSPAGMQVLRQVELCPDRYPRRVGIPAKRPHF